MQLQFFSVFLNLCSFLILFLSSKLGNKVGQEARTFKICNTHQGKEFSTEVNRLVHVAICFSLKRPDSDSEDEGLFWTHPYPFHK